MYVCGKCKENVKEGKKQRDGKREETHQQLDKNDYKQEETSKEKETLCRD